MKTLLRLAFIGAASLCSNFAHAGLGIPYTVDANTLHLWHFDDAPITNLSGVNTNIFSADANTASSVILTNLGNPNPGTPPYTDSILGAPGASGLGTAMASSDKNALSYGGIFPNVSNFCNITSGAFTFEALVLFSNNPILLPNNMEVICGDQPSGTLSIRGWQFRITMGGQMEFNLLGGSSSDNDWKANLPTSGPDAAVANQWYHMAVTYTGYNPTNGTDAPNQLTFYWTLLDGSRSAADPLATFTMTRELSGAAGSTTGTVQPALGIGGSGRKITTGGNGVANGEGTIGAIDEVRISQVARASNGMAFIAGGTFPPTFTAQPPTNTLIGYGQTLSLNSLVSGTAVSAQWQMTNITGGGFTNMPTQTNTGLLISNITFASTGSYRLLISNVLAMKTSVVAQVTVGAAVSELYDTGVNTNGVLDATLATLPDPHYFLEQSADINALGPNAVVWNMAAYPIADQNGNFSNPDNSSAWVGPHSGSYTSPAGQYMYRTYFLLDSVDLSKPFFIQGLWYENEIGTNILINGIPTGNTFSAASSIDGKFSMPFAITNGFVAGLNTLDFVTVTPTTALNTAYEESAVRVEFTSAVGQALPAGKPTILQNPAPVTVSDYNASGGVTATASFSVVATGRPPLTYQWLDQNSSPITGATNRTISFLDPTAGTPAATSFKCVISNTSGAVTSTVASLTLVSTNIPVVFPLASYEIYTNQTLALNASTLAQSGTNPDGLLLTYYTMDTTGTNANLAATISLAGDVIDYVPAPGVTGSDSFTYIFFDAVGNQYTGTNLVKVVSPLPPAFSTASLSAGTNVVLSGTGGAPGGPYYILGTASVTNAVSNWTVLGSGFFNGTGSFSITNPITTNVPVQFFTIQVPQ